MASKDVLNIPEFHGDGIAPELSRCVRTLSKELPLEVRFHDVDLSLDRRRTHSEDAYAEAEEAIRKYGHAMKYPTVTESISPNKVLRERFGFSVIHRPVRSILGVPTRHDCQLDLHVIRVAVGGTYEDAGRHVGSDAAVSIRVIERRPSYHAAKFAFRLARKLGTHVVSTSKYTIQRATDGLFQEVVEEVAEQYPDIPHRAELFDALLAKVIMRPEDYSVLVCPNEYGDFLSDAAYGLVGSIGLGASASYAFDEGANVTLGMFDPAGGTAPDIAGKGVCNPSAALWAFGMLLDYAGYRYVGHALNDAVRDAIASGQTTADLGGDLSTNEFTGVVCTDLRESLAAGVKGT